MVEEVLVACTGEVNKDYPIVTQSGTNIWVLSIRGWKIDD